MGTRHASAGAPVFGYMAIWPSGTDALHRELADHQVPPGNGLGHREGVDSWLRGAAGGEGGGEHGAEGSLARRAQGHVDGGVIVFDAVAPQAAPGADRYRRAEVGPPRPVALLGAVDRAETRRQRRGLGLERGAGLTPPPRRGADDADDSE